MPARFMLDSDACIYIQANKPRVVMDRFDALGTGEAVMSVVTFGELRFGAEKSRLRDQNFALLHELTTALPVLPLPARAADAYGAIRADLTRRGELIGANDLWIAAHARAAGLTLVTNNEREFRRVPGLAVENWAA